MRVLFVTPECAPLTKTGGLGDVSAALPAALRAQGIDVRVLLPAYPAMPLSHAHQRSVWGLASKYSPTANLPTIALLVNHRRTNSTASPLTSSIRYPCTSNARVSQSPASISPFRT